MGVTVLALVGQMQAVSARREPDLPPAVLTIHYGTEEFPAAPIVDGAIRQTLAAGQGVPVDYFSEYLESDHFPADVASDALAEYIRRKYQHRRIDVVIANADPALRFVFEYRATLFPTTPIVYSGVARPESLNREYARDVTGVIRAVAYKETLALALKLHPLTERVFVIANGRDPGNEDAVRAALRPFEQRVRLTFLDQVNVKELLAAVQRIEPRSLVLYIWHTQIAPGSTMYADDLVRLVAEASPVPVYGTNERYLGAGVVGGVVRGTRETGVRLGEMARQMVEGVRPRDIPIEDARLITILDWRQLRRWGIETATIPSDAQIRFKTATLWESARSFVIGTAVVIGAQLLLIVGLVSQRARRRAAEQTLRRQEASLRVSYKRTRHLAQRLMTAQEATYAKIARHLHDGVCQDLVAMSLDLRNLKGTTLIGEHPSVQLVLSRLEQWTLALANTVRGLSHDLHPATLSLLGLASAMKAHCLDVQKRRGVTVRLTIRGDVQGLRREVTVSLFRMLQEALSNAIVHGGARRLTVTLKRLADYVELTVMDDGKGFDTEAVRRNGRGLGLVSMEERACAIGGNFQVIGRPGQGTTVSMRVPAERLIDSDTSPSTEGVWASRPS
jgi:signal transduction histidine kinase